MICPICNKTIDNDAKSCCGISVSALSKTIRPNYSMDYDLKAMAITALCLIASGLFLCIYTVGFGLLNMGVGLWLLITAWRQSEGRNEKKKAEYIQRLRAKS